MQTTACKIPSPMTPLPVLSTPQCCQNPQHIAQQALTAVKGAQLWACQALGVPKHSMHNTLLGMGKLFGLLLSVL